MSNFILLAADAPFYSTWLTSIWLIGLGVLAGLLILAALWGVAAGLSMIPFVGTLAEDRRRLLISGAVVGAVYFVLILFLFVVPAFLNETDAAVQNLLVRLLVFAPLSVLLGICTIALVSRRTVTELPLAIREGPLLPLSIVALVFAVFGLLATFFIPQKPLDILSSLPRLTKTGETVQKFEIKPSGNPAEATGQSIDVSFYIRELRQLEFESTHPLQVALRPFNEIAPTDAVNDIPADDKLDVSRQQIAAAVRNTDEDAGFVSKLYILNEGPNPAQLTVKTVTAAEYEQVKVIPLTAFAVAVVFLLYLFQRSLMPKLSAISLATLKSEMAQPIFVIMLLAASALIVMFVYIPYNTFGEDIKMLKDTGMVLILLIGIFLAVWAASKSVSEEIEGRTALTVLSKPIGRREFILGKFLGISWTLAILFIILGAVLLVAVAYKPIYDARESSRLEATWQSCYSETIQVVPGLLLAYMEAIVFAAVSVAISTRLSMLANFLICMAIYLIGHLTPLMVQSSVAVEAFEPVVFIGRLTATVFPVLDHFNIQAAIAAGTAVPLVYLGWSFLYCLIYSTIAILIALVFFEDRDLT